MKKMDKPKEIILQLKLKVLSSTKEITYDEAIEAVLNMEVLANAKGDPRFHFFQVDQIAKTIRRKV